MADENEEASTADILKIMAEKMNKMIDNQETLSKKVDILEKKSVSASVSNEQIDASPPPSPKTSMGNADDRDVDSLADFEKSDEEQSVHEDEEDEEEMEFQYNGYLLPSKIGPPIGSKMAQDVNSSLLLGRDVQQINAIHSKHPTPSNLTALCVPHMNPEINMRSDTNVANREAHLGSIQKDVNTAIGILANVCGDMGKKQTGKRKFDREKSFRDLNDAMSVLTSAHKNLTRARKISVRPILNESLGALCYAKPEQDRESNHLLFDEDLVRKVDEAYKNRKLHKSAKNGRGQKYRKFKNQGRGAHPSFRRGGRARGRGGFQKREPPKTPDRKKQ